MGDNKGIVVLIVTLFAIFAVIGGCLMGLSNPPTFPAPMFIVGFVFIMIDAIFVFVGLVTACIMYG